MESVLRDSRRNLSIKAKGRGPLRPYAGANILCNYIVGIHLVAPINKDQTGDGRGWVCTDDAADFYPQTAKPR